MRWKASLVAAATVGCLTSIALTQSVIEGTKHNFSEEDWAPEGEICLPCHTPHNAMAGQRRLWNHELTTATYTLRSVAGLQHYAGFTVPDPATAGAVLDSASRMCLSCHDGTVALDSYGGSDGSITITGTALLGTDLSNDHPVGAVAQYPPPVQTGYWNSNYHPAPTSTSLRLQKWAPPGGGAEVNVVGCTTCHNPHGKAGVPYLLQISNDASALCLACHIK
jgi:predicted CXXCH cytochrome family protein